MFKKFPEITKIKITDTPPILYYEKGKVEECLKQWRQQLANCTHRECTCICCADLFEALPKEKKIR